MTMPSAAPQKNMADSNLLIAGLIRNGEGTIRREVKRLLTAAAGFRRTQVLVVESDSTDGTVKELSLMAQADPRVSYITLGCLGDRLPCRSERMAHCRNTYIQNLRENASYADVDYVLVADLDGMNDLLNATALRSCFEVEHDWGVLCANQDGYYYDIWALRHPDWCPQDCLAQLSRLEPLFGHATARDIAVYSRQIHIPRHTALIAVESAFGGLALYTRAALLSGGYAARDDDGQEICEHVPHHRRIGRAGHAIYINPGLINTGFTIHTRHKKTGKVIRNALKACFARGA